jgi:threonine/homoserine/homoserine lactone efflux protein
MHLILFLKGIAVGVAIAAPLGPVGILCIQRSLVRGVFYGLASGLGAALADAMFGAIAAFGIGFVADFMTRERYWLQLAGATLLLVMGTHTVLAKWRPRGPRLEANDLLHDWATTFALTITNPITLFSLGAVFVAVGITQGTETFEGAAAVVAGVLTGSALWWTVLASGVSLWRDRLSSDYLRRIHSASGIVMLALGAGVLVHLWT